MDALKKFLQKKKTDKVFKGAGPGHKLTAESGPSAGGGSRGQSSSPGGGHGHGHSGHSQSTSKSPHKGGGGGGGTSEEKRAAAAAALARLEKNKKPGDVDEDKMRASRQVAFIKEQARRELDAEKEAREAGEKKGGGKGTTVEAGSSNEGFATRSGRARNPEAMAVSGVFFTCPLIGPEILTKEEIEDNIKKFLVDQPEEELGVTACLLIHSCNKPFEKVNYCVETLSKYLDNIISAPEEQKFRRIRCSNKVFQEKILPAFGAEQFLIAAGFRKSIMKADPSSDTEEEFWVFHPQDESSFTAQLIELRDMLRQTTPIKPELDRNLQVLIPSQVTSRRELPDEFFTLSLEEVRKEQQLKSELLEQEQTLRTKAMRERDEQRELRLYRYGIMRVRFPDGFTLQGTFKAHEKLSNLYEFVQENLVQNVKFELIRSGGGDPLTDLNSTLAELKLPPSSILNFKVHSAPAPLATGEISFLKPDILALVRSLNLD